MQLSLPNITEPTALTVYENHLYISDRDKIVLVNKDGSQFRELRNATSDVHGLLLYDKNLRKLTGKYLQFHQGFRFFPRLVGRSDPWSKNLWVIF